MSNCIDIELIKDKILANTPTNHFEINRTIDYIEFYIYCNKYETTKGDISNQLFKNDLTIQEENDSIEDDNEVPSSRNYSTRNRSRKDESNEEILENIMLYLYERLDLYSDYYPFNIENEIISLKDNLSEKQLMYLSFITCSNLNLINSCQSSLTSDFELITYYALQNLFKDKLLVKSMSTKNDTVNSYRGYTRSKIKEFAEELGLETSIKKIEKNINPRSVQDEGVDFVAWLDFTDNRQNNIIFLVQATCGKNSFNKSLEPKKYENYVNFQVDPIITLSTPYHLDGDETLGKSFTLGRYRLLDLISKEDLDALASENLESFDLVNSIKKTIEISS